MFSSVRSLCCSATSSFSDGIFHTNQQRCWRIFILQITISKYQQFYICTRPIYMYIIFQHKQNIIHMKILTDQYLCNCASNLPPTLKSLLYLWFYSILFSTFFPHGKSERITWKSTHRCASLTWISCITCILYCIG